MPWHGCLSPSGGIEQRSIASGLAGAVVPKTKQGGVSQGMASAWGPSPWQQMGSHGFGRSEEHTSELQSRPHLVCRLLLEKKKKHDSALEVVQPQRHVNCDARA